MKLQSRHLFAFSSFLFDPESGDLTQNGVRVPLNKQTAELLTVLLTRAGDLVTREEIRDVLWPRHEIANYEKVINNGISRLRYIFRDDPLNPRFIERIPKRGYRLIIEVTLVDPPEKKSPDTSPPRRTTPVAPTPPVADLPSPADIPSLIEIPPLPAIPSPAETPTPELPPATDPIPSNQAPSNHAPTTPPQPEPPSSSPSSNPSASPSVNQPIQRSLLSRHPALFTLSALLVITAAIAIGLFLKDRKTAAPPAFISIGIPPFEAEGPEAKQLADGFRLDLTDALSQLPRIQVRAAHSFTSSKYDDAGIRNLAQTLQLDTLLFCKLTLNGDQIQLQVEVVRGSDAVHLASFHYSGTKDQMVSIRDEIERDVYARLESTALNGRQVPGSTENPKAYEAYLNARAFLLRWTDEPLDKVLEGFRTAIALDPGFAKAYAEMGSAYVIAAEHSMAPRDNAYRKAEEFAQKAIALDPSQAEAHATLGYIRFRRDWDAASAERELRQAIDLEPNQAIHHAMLALVLGNTGHFEESLHQIDLAHEDDPLWPPVYMGEIYITLGARLNDRAMNAVNKLIRIKPEWPLARDQQAWAFWYSGRYEEAIASWRAMALLGKDSERLALEDRGLQAFHQGGLPAYARVRLKAIQSGHIWAQPNDFEPGEWYLVAGDQERALVEIRAMVKNHSPEALQLAVSPAYNPLHENPEFLALLAQVGLTLPHNYPKP
ncbi:winged helix-turn-helix domain-containing tetratricopeptide repeat protein [Acidicapsa ligni]|uniref:winged helix-turn-helix domain-containing tetratricopeptide repeat protein n=1 Tax=Acidicapsa ligni TaxID=542300 RepID=UPI0021DFDDDC|nr:winged helix-turn-helix domain-containing protein [Acidicapsa ligni]